MLTLAAPYPAPKSSRTAPSAATEWVCAGSGTARLSRATEPTVTRRLPYRRQSRPTRAMVATAPAEMQSRARPSALCEACTWARTSGMRTTQAANRKPSIAKKAVRASLAADQVRGARTAAVAAVVAGSVVVSAAEDRASVLFSSGTKSE
ncbi:hypothetical protein GCM10009663_40680 [Kitasatospora arboriphila]|uniref:Uncharacterized protein n=1 Tax=Kitasatospora arboriphila TaxID=258052 RepID=A0ABN1TNT6_9ACTN